MNAHRPTVAVLAPLSTRSLLLAATAALLVGLLGSSSRAADDSQYKVVDGIGVFYGLMPAAIVRGHSPAHPEGSMHDGSQHHGNVHLVVALFDSTTFGRIENARVTARVAPLGLGGPQRQLEPMQIAGTISYGAFVRMAPGDRYTIHLEIELPGAIRATSVDFLYDNR